MLPSTFLFMVSIQNIDTHILLFIHFYHFFGLNGNLHLTLNVKVMFPFIFLFHGVLIQRHSYSSFFWLRHSYEIKASFEYTHFLVICLYSHSIVLILVKVTLKANFLLTSVTILFCLFLVLKFLWPFVRVMSRSNLYRHGLGINCHMSSDIQPSNERLLDPAL